MSRFLNHLRYRKLKGANRAVKVLIISDAFFFSSMALVEVVFSVFIVTQVKGATVAHLGIGNALFMFGILITEPLLSNYFDNSENIKAAFYGFLLGNLLKSVARLLFIVISTIPAFYIIYFLLGIIHSIEYPSFSKLFTVFIDKSLESSEWGYKDTFVSLGKLFTLFASGYIVIYFGYNMLFISSAVFMFLSGVVLPYIYRKDFLGLR